MGSTFNPGFLLALVTFAVISLVQCQTQDKPRIYSLHILSDVKYRFATTLVTSRLANPANGSREAVFRVTLPKEAFISDFTMEIDGVIYPGSVKGKEQAKKEFQAAKKKGQSAGHVSQSPRDTSNFKVEVNVAALSKVTFNLTYQELLQRKRGVYQHKIYVNPGQPVDDLQVQVSIKESREITALRVPPISSDILTNEIQENQIAVITRSDPKSALVSYIPSLEEQTEKSPTGIAGQFIVEYDVNRSLDAGDLLVVNGYFVHFIAPEIKDDIPKDIIFILDKSGSMSGKKIVQLKEAMFEILSDLQPQDRFTIAKFDSSVRFMYKKFMKATTENIFDAKKQMKSMGASGGTNINEALLVSIDRFLKQQNVDYSERAPVIFFLTDGEASSGVTNNDQILKNALEKNQKSELDIPINTLAFGSGADYKLIQKLALQNNGVARKIYEASDAKLQITGFYSEVSNTMMRNVSVEYLGDTVDVNSLTKSKLGNLFGGSEIVVAGKLTDGTSTLDLNVLGNAAKGNLMLSLNPTDNIIDINKVPELTKDEDFAKITEKMWAYLTIKEKLKMIDSGDVQPEEMEQLKKEVLDMSIKYSFVTRLTSMVVTKPDDKPSVDELAEGTGGKLQDQSGNQGPAPSGNQRPAPSRNQGPRGNKGKGRGKSRRRYSSGGGGYSGGGGGDPHYMVRLYGLDHPVCFDFNSETEEFYKLIDDPVHDVYITAASVVSERLQASGAHKSFIGQVGLSTKHHTFVFTPDAIIVDKKVLSWDDRDAHNFGNNSFSVNKDGDGLATVVLNFHFGAVIFIQRHMRPDKGWLNYLNIYVVGEDHFSKKTHGLIGQFVNGQKHVVVKKQFANPSDHAVLKLQVKEGPRFHSGGEGKGTKIHHAVRAKLVRRKEIVYRGWEKCFLVHSPFVELFVGKHSDFVVPALLPYLETVGSDNHSE